MNGLGLFSGIKRWIKRNIKTLEAIALVICPPVAAALATADAAGAFDVEGKITTTELSLSDQNILNPWDANYFQPFYTSLLHTLNNQVLKKSLPINQRIQFLNDILIKIAAVKLYYKNNDNAGLSADGIANRLEYLDTSFNAINSVVFNDFSEFISIETIDISQNFKSIDLSLLNVSKTIDFNVPVNVLKVGENLNDLTPSPIVLAQNPSPTLADIKNTIATAVNQTTTGANNNTTPTKTNGLKIVAFSVLAFFGIRELIK